MSQVIPLEMLRTGESGQICEVDGTEEFVHRLAEMGLRTGARVEMLRAGSPCIVSLDQQRMSYRADEIATVLVEVDP